MKRSDLPAGAQDFARIASLKFGRLTSRARMTPAFLICGAQRCGTTTMYRTLRQHPSILPPVLHKGVHYFDTGYLRGRGWYQAHFPTKLTAAVVKKRTGTEAMTFESSPYYLFNPLAADRIARDLPEARIIVLLRDPVERAYSAHTHEKARGYESESFEAALELEDSRLAGEEAKIIADPAYLSFSHQHHGYVTRGRYIDQLLRLEKAVGRERLHVVDSDDFFDRPEPLWRETLDFLGMPSDSIPVFEKHNARPRSPMSESLRASLAQGYLADDERLAEWWGQTPSWRR
jgi:hypothetical protein